MPVLPEGRAGLAGSPARMDPLLLAKIAALELRARTVAQGALAGRHKSARLGPALEFAGHRPYAPGDEWRRVDWKVYGRTDRWVVRQQEEEAHLRGTLLLDASRSMAFSAGGRPPKIRYAAVLAAALGYLLIRRREAAGLGFFAEGLRDFIPPQGGAPHWARLLDALEGVEPGGTTDFPAALEAAGQRLPRRGLVLILSDFLSPPEAVLSAVRTLAASRRDVAALQVLDPDERAFRFEGEILFEDLETGRTVRADAGDVARLYRERMEERLDRLGRAFASFGVDWQIFETDRPPEEGLSLFLQRRSAR